jgi:hypothetical protein
MGTVASNEQVQHESPSQAPMTLLQLWFGPGPHEALQAVLLTNTFSLSHKPAAGQQRKVRSYKTGTIDCRKRNTYDTSKHIIIRAQQLLSRYIRHRSGIPFADVKQLMRLRTGAHHLAIETGRWVHPIFPRQLRTVQNASIQ